MARLANPNVLNLRPGQPARLLVTGSELGEAVIRPRTGPGALLTRVLRLYLGPPWSALGVAYVDVSGDGLIEVLLPWLPKEGEGPLALRLEADGQEPAKAYSVFVERVAAGPGRQGV